MKTTIGIFEAKTHLSEICEKVAETGVEYVVTRRGRAVARIVPAIPEPTSRIGILARMSQTDETHGPIGNEGEDFPDVWETRRGSKASPLENEEKANP